MDLLGQFPRVSNGDPFLLVMIDLYSKVTRAVLTCKTPTALNASLFVDGYIIPYGMLNYLVTDNGT